MIDTVVVNGHDKIIIQRFYCLQVTADDKDNYRQYIDDEIRLFPDVQ